MPELPEVETISKRLRPYLSGKTIAKIIQHHPKTFQGSAEKIEGLQILGVLRRAKMIRIQLEKGFNLLIHLKMTGQLIYVDDKHRVGGGHPTEDWISQLPSKHTRTELHFTDGSKLFFNDQRLFGWIRVLNDKEVEEEFAKYAPDVTSPEFTLSYFSRIVQKRSVPIKLLIMDNTIVSGIGNIYACDALNLAQLSPFQKANTLNTVQIETLYNAAKSIIQKGIDLGGATTDGKYIDVHGFAGKYQLEARVYDRKGKQCLHCAGEILKEKLGGRGTYYCAKCQKK
ncbi:MAG: bifunctional DNA-formamidopyrimidine glycosylase/DNA-(apurinic or apyrimidinic site) lyase [Patescibacteria group bacterium]